MGKAIAREFLWLVVGLIVSIPLGLVFLWFLRQKHRRLFLNPSSAKNNNKPLTDLLENYVPRAPIVGS